MTKCLHVIISNFLIMVNTNYKHIITKALLSIAVCTVLKCTLEIKINLRNVQHLFVVKTCAS